MSATAKPASTSAWSLWGQGLLHGPSQIFFQKNWLTGLLIYAAFFVASWQLGILGVLGCIGGCLGGWIVRFSLQNVSTGMQGFCGTLVGSAVYLALGGDQWYCYVLAFAGGLATGPVTWVINEAFTKTKLAKYQLPYTTSPFVIVATVIAVSTLRLAVPAAKETMPTAAVPGAASSLLTNISQVVLIDNLWSGALILLGLFIASWRAGVAAVLGSGLGTVVALIMGQTPAEISNGLVGYSGVLTAIALTSTFLVSRAGSWLYSLPWIVVTAVVTVLMHRLGLDTYTWPYILTTWLALVIAYYIGGSLKRP